MRVLIRTKIVQGSHIVEIKIFKGTAHRTLRIKSETTWELCLLFTCKYAYRFYKYDTVCMRKNPYFKVLYSSVILNFLLNERMYLSYM